MPPISRPSLIPPELRELVENAEILDIDFEGTMIPTEVVMQISFLRLVTDFGGKADIYDIEKMAVGKAVKEIVETIQAEYKPVSPKDGRTLSVAELLEHQKKVYSDLVEEYDLRIFPFMKEILKTAKEGETGPKRTMLISNGIESLIRGIFKKEGLETFIDEIHASDSPSRLRFREPTNKALFFADKTTTQYIGPGNDPSRLVNIVPPEKIVLFEDNSSTIGKTQAAMRAAREEVFAYIQSIVPRTPMPDISGLAIKEVYIEHEFNLKKGYAANTGINLQGFAPPAMCEKYGVHVPSAQLG